MKKKQLSISVEGDELQISIGIDTLCHACEVGRQYGLGAVKITDDKAFLKGIERELKHEDEDGSTPVHRLFDEAVTQMLENGEEGIEPEEDA